MTPRSSPDRGVLWLKRRVARALCTDRVGRVIGIALGNRIPCGGLVVDTRSEVFSPRVKAQLFWRIYESAESRFVRRYLVGSQCAVELGSSLGVVSTHLASVMAGGGRLICVEANPALITTVEAALAPVARARGLNVAVVHAAIVAEGAPQEARLSVGAETVASKVVAGAAAATPTLGVPALALSELLRRHDVSDYDLLCDIEGAEVAFILGDHDALARCRRMVIELHDTTVGTSEVGAEELLQALVARGFAVVDRRGPVAVLEWARR